MAQRSPTNPRYQQDRAGKTRKSAASAKPKRRAGEAASSGSSGKSEGKKKKGRTPAITTPEIKKWRRRSLSLLGAALVIAAVGIIPQVQSALEGSRVLLGLVIVLYAVPLGSAVYIDWVIVRRLRNAELDRLKKDKKEKKGR